MVEGLECWTFDPEALSPVLTTSGFVLVVPSLHFYLKNHFSHLSISISLFVIIFYSFDVNIFYDFDRKICKMLVINYCCDALLNIL